MEHETEGHSSPNVHDCNVVVLKNNWIGFVDPQGHFSPIAGMMLWSHTKQQGECGVMPILPALVFHCLDRLT
jgi:hypothetical protein